MKMQGGRVTRLRQEPAVTQSTQTSQTSQAGRATPIGIPIVTTTYADYPDLSETYPDGDYAYAAWKAGEITTTQFASEVLKAIDADIEDGVLPPDVATFSELHDYVDANEYVLDVMGSVTSGDDDLALASAITSEVDRQLVARAA
jgi:hypothetical protein